MHHVDACKSSGECPSPKFPPVHLCCYWVSRGMCNAVLLPCMGIPKIVPHLGFQGSTASGGVSARACEHSGDAFHIRDYSNVPAWIRACVSLGVM